MVQVSNRWYPISFLRHKVNYFFLYAEHFMFIFPTFPPFFIPKVLFCPESHVKWMENAQIMPIKIEKEVQEVTPSQKPLRRDRHGLFDVSDCPEGTTDGDRHIPF